MHIVAQKYFESQGHRSPVYCLSQYQIGTVISGGGEGWIIKWTEADPENGLLLASVGVSVFSIQYLPDADLIIAGDRNGFIHWIKSHGKSEGKFAHKGEVFGIHRIGDFVYTIGKDGFLVKWGIFNQSSIQSIRISKHTLRSFICNIDESTAFIGDGEGMVHLIDLNRFEVVNSFMAHYGTVFSLALNSEGNLISGGKDAHLKLWETSADFRLIVDHPAHWFSIYAIKEHPNLPIIATASRDKQIRIWESVNLDPILTLDYAKYQGHIRSVNALNWTENGEMLISTGDDAKIIFWKLNNSFK